MKSTAQAEVRERYRSLTGSRNEVESVAEENLPKWQAEHAPQYPVDCKTYGTVK